MKAITVTLLLAASILGSSAALANADDAKWIAQCQQDNKDEKGATPDIVTKYCTCMNNKMDNNETKTITQWEKTHPDEQKACSKEAGWN